MSLLRKERRDKRSENNKEGLVAVQQPDGSIKHISREEWEDGSDDEHDEPEE